MKSDYKKLLEELKAVGQGDVVPIETIEQDYAISFLLKTMSDHPELSGTLVFRGGTSLRKCYFPNYRYSMDLDYSVRESLPLEQYNRILGDVARQTQELLMAAHPGLEFQVAVKQIGERGEHGDSQDSHKFLVKFPWHLQHKNPGRAGRMIKLDTSHSEPVLLGTENRQLIHRYGISTVTSSVTCLTLDELLAEKYVAMCDVLSRREQDVRQSTRPRDYFDYDQVLAEHGIENKENFLSAILIKAKRRRLEVRSVDELLSPQAVAKLVMDWRPFLSQVVPGLSDCRAAVTRIEEKMQKIFPDFDQSLKAAEARAKSLRTSSGH